MSITRDLALNLRERVLPAGRSRYGLVIGIDRYRDTRLDLRCATADAKLIHGLMLDPDCGVFAEGNVELLLDADATRDRIWQSLAGLRRKAGPEDTVWVYFAGHAAPEDDQTYWLAHDSDVNDLYATGLGSGHISEALSRVGADRRVVLLDCCHAAATAMQANPTRSAVPAEELLGRFQGRGAVTLCSSAGGQRSVELEEHGHGAFTYYLERGLRGEADLDGDGVVTAEELWTYLEGKVASAARQVGVDQSPMMIGQFSHGLPLSVCPEYLRTRSSLAGMIGGLVGLEEDDLTTEEARWCLQLLARPTVEPRERRLLEFLKQEAKAGSAGPGLRLAIQGAMTPADGASIAAHSQAVFDQAGEKLSTYAERIEPEISPDHDLQMIGKIRKDLLSIITAKVSRDLSRLRMECSRDVEACVATQLRGKDDKEHLEAVYAERLPLWQRASEAKILDGMWLYARCLQEGLGDYRNESVAFELYEEVAGRGHALAQCSLGNCYDEGIGVSKDGREVVKWARKAAEQGDADGQCTLGDCYLEGTGVSKDGGEAVKWCRKAAEQGDADAQYDLGICYFNGTGVPEDEEKAGKWFRKSADQGFESAVEGLENLDELDDGNCSISTSVVAAIGGPDDCAELQALRSFRDGYMQGLPARRAEVLEYYDVAPRVVAAVEASHDARQEWHRVFGEFLTPAVEAISAGRLAEAHDLYREMVKDLEAKWLCAPCREGDSKPC